MSTPPPPWWKGARGEWLVAIQLALIALVFIGPATVRGWPRRPFRSESVTCDDSLHHARRLDRTAIGKGRS